MSIEKRKDKYVVRVYLGGGNYKSKSFDKLKDAQAYERQLNNFKRNTFDKTVSDKTILSVVFERYIDFLSQTKKDSTVRNYKSNFNKWISPILGSLAIGSINQVTLNRFVQQLRLKHASEYIVSYSLIVTNEILNFASNNVEKYINVNPMDNFQRNALPYNPTESIKYWSKDEVQKVLAASLGSPYYSLFVVMINTGMRISEALALKESDIDFKTGVIRLTSQFTIYSPKTNEPKFKASTLCLTSLKNYQARTIPLNKMATQFLKREIELNEGSHFIFSNRHERDSLVVLKRGPKPTLIETSVISKRVINNFITKISSIAEVSDIGPHGLRHTFAAHFLMNGGDIYTLSRILGHKSINSTMIYSHLSESFLKSAMSIVEFGG